MENSAAESTDLFRPTHDPLPGRIAGSDDGKGSMDLSSVIAPAAAVLPFAAVLALCAFLLSLPSGEGRRIAVPPVMSNPQPIGAQASSPASEDEHPIIDMAQRTSSPVSGDDLPQGNTPQAPLVEVGASFASFPIVAAPAVDIKPGAFSAMATWWAQRARRDHAAPRKVAVFTRQYRRHREVVRSEMGCPPSVCLGGAEKSAMPPLLPNPKKWADGGS
jgi:hypothetical protein